MSQAAGTLANLNSIAQFESIPIRRSKTASVLLVCAVLSLSLLALHAPLITSLSVRQLSKSAKMDEPRQTVDAAAPPPLKIEPIALLVPQPAPRWVEGDSPLLPPAPILCANSLRSPPVA